MMLSCRAGLAALMKKQRARPRCSIPIASSSSFRPLSKGSDKRFRPSRFGAKSRLGARAHRGEPIQQYSTINSEQNAEPVSSLLSENKAKNPSFQQLKIHFFHSAVPMIGFGCMDNFVMIQAGDLIDNTIGVKFGLATLTAAAFGQICSDVSGVAFGGVIEAAAVRLGLPIADLTPAQRRLPNVKLVGTLGMMCGVVLGCLIGMASLLFLDLESAERAKHQAELNTIFETVLHHGHKVINAERASLFILDEEKGVLWSKVATGTGHAIISLPKDKGLVGLCYRTGEPVIVDNAYKHKDFNQEVDAMLEYKTRSVLCWPIFADAQVSDGNNCECKFTSSSLSGEVGKHGRQSGRIIGVIEMINKIEDEEGEKSFTSNDLKLCEMLAYHVSIFLRKQSKQVCPRSFPTQSRWHNIDFLHQLGLGHSLCCLR